MEEARTPCATSSTLAPQQAESAARLFGAEVVRDGRPDSTGRCRLWSRPLHDTHADLLRQVPPAREDRSLREAIHDVISRRRRDRKRSGSRPGALLYVGHFRRTFPASAAGPFAGRVGRCRRRDGGLSSARAAGSPGRRCRTTRSPDEHGGVLWDTGSHALDMALFASCLDGWPDCDVEVLAVERDKAEPSHDFRARFALSGGHPVRQTRVSSCTSAERTRCRISSSFPASVVRSPSASAWIGTCA